ncbi:hypothetical protein MKW94_020268 [Papaver nudicaule]|uniref:Matrin-type domain-containing protein n=1 Tax=Papaver nudicaule TaxID=74823 RepID=A0AA41V2R3_PAPNU|nr:hypothetical protein [Papaver nudicaule]
MSSTLLEITRSTHQRAERFETLIVKDLGNEPASNRERLFQDHRVRNNVEEIISCTHKLIGIYKDKDHARKDEIDALGGGQGTDDDVLFTTFYDGLKEIHQNHRRHPDSRALVVCEEDLPRGEEQPQVEFSGEEGHGGRCLDLHDLYNEYVNLDPSQRMEYAAYLDVFSQPHQIPCKLKLTRRYREYLEHLLEYLISFLRRKQPLQDLGRIFSKVETDFEHLWEEENGKLQLLGGKRKGWDGDSIDLAQYSTVHELMEVGRDRLKEASDALGLKSGGTLQQLAGRLFLTKHTPVQQLGRKHLSASSHETEELKEISLNESKLKRLCELLSETIQQTKENVQRKQALTVDEREKEAEEEEGEQVDTDSDDEEKQIHNPLKLPTGWDNKPIPYWLYKLHGLGQEFKCEICGSHSYWGRRAFERHFREPRHQGGMQCLGIPNTNNFNEITSIEEAKALWEKIKARQGGSKWRPDVEEEYEDWEGNIYNKKTYNDLKRQRLI